MTADRRSPRRGLYKAVSFLAAMVVALTARPVAAGSLTVSPVSGNASTFAPLTATIPTRFEGQVRSISGKYWRVDSFTVLLTPFTEFVQKRGNAEAGAWVRVVGTQSDSAVTATLIEVLRPAGSPTPLYQYTGAVTKKGNTFWIVGDQYFLVTPGTRLVGELGIDSLAQVTARRVEKELEALQITDVASDPASVPKAIEGVVQMVTGGSLVVDDTTIEVPPEMTVPVDQGDTVEVSAVDEGDSLVALHVQVVDVASQALVTGFLTAVDGIGQDDQTLSMLVFEGGNTSIQQVRVTPQTYVDEDSAVLEPDLEAEIQGQKVAAGGIDAALVRLNEPVPGAAAGALVPGATGQIWRVGADRVWFGSDPMERQALTAAGIAAKAASDSPATGPSGEVVVRGLRLSNGVLVAKELVTGPAATAALAAAETTPTANNAIDWRGPNDINPSAIDAAKPTVLFDATGGGHAVYESKGVIYYSHESPGGDWAQARKIGTGTMPSAVIDANGLVHVAYRAQFLNNYDIMHVRMLGNGSWSLPTVVAPTSGSSADPSIAADQTGKVYVAWMDLTSGNWAIQLGTWDGRYWTSAPVYYGRGQSPSLAVEPDGTLFVAWQDRIPTATDPYGKYDIFASELKDQYWTLPSDVSDNWTWRPGSNSVGVRLAIATDGFAHLAWIDDSTQIRYDFGREGYWPLPVDVGPKRTLVRGISLQTAVDGMLYLAIDEGESLSVAVTPPRTEVWPEAQTVATQGKPSGNVSDVSLSSSPDRVVVTWVQPNGMGSTGVYESRHTTVRPLLKFYLPTLVKP